MYAAKHEVWWTGNSITEGIMMCHKHCEIPQWCVSSRCNWPVGTSDKSPGSDDLPSSSTRFSLKTNAETSDEIIPWISQEYPIWIWSVANSSPFFLAKFPRCSAWAFNFCGWWVETYWRSSTLMWWIDHAWIWNRFVSRIFNALTEMCKLSHHSHRLMITQ